jgi:hypothetical protein
LAGWPAIFFFTFSIIKLLTKLLSIIYIKK